MNATWTEDRRQESNSKYRKNEKHTILNRSQDRHYGQ